MPQTQLQMVVLAEIMVVLMLVVEQEILLDQVVVCILHKTQELVELY
jgi:hypothetical protein